MVGNFRKLARRADIFALIFIIIPTAISAVYFGFLASDVYISESRFVVRSPDKPAQTGLGVLFKGLGFSNAGDEMAISREAVLSRDALRTLEKQHAFSQAFRRTNISIFNRFDPFGFATSFEDLYQYYLGKVDVEQNSSTSVATLKVKAYSPKDAQKFNAQLLSMAEETVNKLNVRGRQDLIRYSESEYESAKDYARKAALSLSYYRNQKKILDPEAQASAQLQMVSKLQDELISSQSELRLLQNLTPQNPRIPILQQKADGLSGEIQAQLAALAGGRNSLATNSAQYQRLILESQFADKQLAASMAALEQARNEARRQQAYVERIVQPNLPDYPEEPRRLRGILTTFVLGLVAWGIARMLLAGLMEHRE